MNKFSLYLQYFSVVLTTVKAIENSFADAPGASKLQLALGAIQAGADGISQTGIPEAHVQYISQLISLVVNMLNTSGIFQHKALPTT